MSTWKRRKGLEDERSEDQRQEDRRLALRSLWEKIEDAAWVEHQTMEAMQQILLSINARKICVVEIPGVVREERCTEKAYCFSDGTRTVFLPKSQCEWDPIDKIMQMPEWLALEKELV